MWICICFISNFDTISLISQNNLVSTMETKIIGQTNYDVTDQNNVCLECL